MHLIEVIRRVSLERRVHEFGARDCGGSESCPSDSGTLLKV